MLFPSSSNRTSLELKSITCIGNRAAALTSNRTSLELKCLQFLYPLATGKPSNRTSLELKSISLPDSATLFLL